ncbi:protein kinase-like domain, Phloem protein 2-like protein [Artemisia annua]|uniref:Protein kinase-like domain, Phloem protein 2-like protein n=1 Tax=Artemisia annua TaxID=35608 RepID=A0A2U1PXL9_ARTAN|nr:protein kinase-like domain, Phloem protein 2-like protein [Artemisia annua]
MASFVTEFKHLEIQLEEIISATNNFDESKVIGRGGFGKVYAGELSLSQSGEKSLVAIKRLDRKYGQGDPEFFKEIRMLTCYRHENLISLLGFCCQGDEMILIYEHASRGSLDRYLSSADLTWTQRLRICIDAAKGLSFLHDPNGTQQRVLHCDIKSANILLDNNMTAKVSDFGLSKMGPANQQYSLLITGAVGTPGYCDPLYIETYSLTKESDVYSFGVVLLEVLSGRLCFEYVKGQLKVYVPLWKKSYEDNKLNEIIMQDLIQQMDPSSLKTFSDIAFQCLRKAREERPAMSRVVEELEIALDSQEFPDLRLELVTRHEAILKAVDPLLIYKTGKQLKELLTKGLTINEGKTVELPVFEEYQYIVEAASQSLFYTSLQELKQILSRGIYLKDYKTWFSLNEKGQHCHMISMKDCLIPDEYSTPQYESHYKSRFPAGLYQTNKNGFKTHVKTQFLSPSITYTVNLVFCTFLVFRKLKYRLRGEKTTSAVKLANNREVDHWLSIVELFQFTSDGSIVELEITFDNHRANLELEGILFQPLEKNYDATLNDQNFFNEYLSNPNDEWRGHNTPNDEGVASSYPRSTITSSESETNGNATSMGDKTPSEGSVPSSSDSVQAHPIQNIKNHGFWQVYPLSMGSRVYSYAQTPEVDSGIGGQNPTGQSSNFSTRTNPFSFNPSGQKTSTFGTPGLLAQLIHSILHPLGLQHLIMKPTTN